ncbi:MAG: methionyl-tRNA formyltransferase [Planctomycetota bacterium]
MRIAFLGTGDFGRPALVRLAPDVALAISQPDRPAGRGREIHPTAIHALADELGIRHIQTEDVNALPIDSLFKDIDLAVVVAFGQKLGPAVLAAPRLGCVNIHASLLPRYRGAAPYQWAVINGDRTTGVTVFQINEKWDAGAILGVRETEISETETADELHDRLAIVGAALIVEVLNDLAAGRARPLHQDAAQATRAPKLKKSDGAVDWSQPARNVSRRINGLWSWPAAAARFSGPAGKVESVQLARAQPIEDAAPEDTPCGALRSDGLVQTGRGAVRILEIKPAGGKLMPFDAFARGRGIAPPARFLPLETP